MIAYGLPIAATLALWWVSTGVILRLDSLDRRTFGRSMAWASVILLLSLWLARQSSGQTTPGAAYLAFACGLVAWGWQLLSFYTGFVTGPRRSACPPDCRGLSRFVEAARTSLHHELSAVLGALALLALTYGQPNRLALWTYLLLWWHAPERQTQRLFRRAQFGRGYAAGPFGLSRELHAPAADESCFPVLGDGLHDCDDAAVRARLARGCDGVRDRRQYDACGFDGARGRGTLVPGRADRRQCDLALVPAAAGRRRGARNCAAGRGGARRDRRAGDGSRGRGIWNSRIRGAPVFRRSATRATLRRCSISSRPGASANWKAFRGSCARTRIGFAFEAGKGRARMEAFAPHRSHEPRMIARGRRFDRVRLQAALDGCAALL